MDLLRAVTVLHCPPVPASNISSPMTSPFCPTCSDILCYRYLVVLVRVFGEGCKLSSESASGDSDGCRLVPSSRTDGTVGVTDFKVWKIRDPARRFSRPNPKCPSFSHDYRSGNVPSMASLFLVCSKLFVMTCGFPSRIIALRQNGNLTRLRGRIHRGASP
ncbi:hypothetical protein FA95DRAFT_1553832 [Auriscalpium vulgare]|uniref:Uncharacterized protein n=1 Tax=Auriscalpium vulgare TaxID=40419 RepID=A0ACB8S6F3_9AGAM|nr:hypothetical protein FA95DRAFT_1553832 [Auriscalpium vulgare]